MICSSHKLTTKRNIQTGLKRLARSVWCETVLVMGEGEAVSSINHHIEPYCTSCFRLQPLIN